MGPLYGMAGLAEAAFAQAAGFLCLGVALVFAAALAALTLRSRTAAVAGAVVWGLLALWLQPWREFSPEPSDDPDLRSFHAIFSQLAWWWAAGSLGLAVAAARAFWPRRAGSAPPTPGGRLAVLGRVGCFGVLCLGFLLFARLSRWER